MRISDWSSDVCSSDLLTVGDGFADKVAQGPLIDDAAIAKVKEHVKDALDKGAKVTVGGKAHELGGRFFQPTVLSNVSEDMICMQEETFGPLEHVIKFSEENKDIELDKNTEYGLTYYVYSSDIARNIGDSEARGEGRVEVNNDRRANRV